MNFNAGVNDGLIGGLAGKEAEQGRFMVAGEHKYLELHASTTTTSRGNVFLNGLHFNEFIFSIVLSVYSCIIDIALQVNSS